MRKLLLTLVIGLTIGSCTEPNITPENTGTKYGEYGQDIQELTIEPELFISSPLEEVIQIGEHIKEPVITQSIKKIK